MRFVFVGAAGAADGAATAFEKVLGGGIGIRHQPTAALPEQG
jgi:hypothetical protein